MCGVIGLIYEKPRSDLGRVAAELLKTLEYRGYDSTGAAFQGEGTSITLLKGVGAPSLLVDKLGITKVGGQILCGQVRWATFGSVTENNSQPHEVECKIHLYGAHNGNVTNCDDLKLWLTHEGHNVRSDNDGEMVVHTIEHFFAVEINSLPLNRRDDPASRRACMRKAIVEASARLFGSYAAVIVDPVSRVLWAIKQGSSLYFGIGRDEVGGAFALASSDLSSVLKLTRVLVPVVEGEFVEYTPAGHRVYTLRTCGSEKAGDALERQPFRSRLQASDIALSPEFDTYMEQEIHAQIETCRKVAAMFLGGTSASQILTPYINSLDESLRTELKSSITAMRDECCDEEIRNRFVQLADSRAMQTLLQSIPVEVKQEGTNASAAQLGSRLASSEAGFFTDLLKMARSDNDLLAVRLMDVFLERDEFGEYNSVVDEFSHGCARAISAGNRIFVVCCGSSYHAAKAGALFFNEIARAEVLPVLPGEFRGQYSKSLHSGDVVLAVSQSGETKDLIDVLNQVIDTGLDIRRVALVNNVSSTLAQEKCELALPLRCGPEVAVPATKSYMNQMVVFYCLAMRLAECRASQMPAGDILRGRIEVDLVKRREALTKLPDLIASALRSTESEVERAARLLFLSPSIHILAIRLLAVAKEGALKIREVVLNHTEGFEGSEFKHGPNTILGLNTIYGPAQLDNFLKTLAENIERVMSKANTADLSLDLQRKMIGTVLGSLFSQAPAWHQLSPREQLFLEDNFDRTGLMSSLYEDYPLLYVTGPEEQDINLAVSQINTHKIRGCKTIVIAEENASLRQAAEKPPCDNPNYQSLFISLPRTADTLMVMFTSTVVLQRLALKMSIFKGRYLDSHGVVGHGVHPDVPKNVSKSITVD